MTGKQICYRNGIDMPLDSKKAGFTLAEILFTITIIGIVAALTIPGLVQSIQDSQNKAAFKKIYSNLSAVTNQIISDNSNAVANWSNHNKLRDEYGKYLDFIRKCDLHSSMDGVCWPATTKYLNNTIRSSIDTNTVSMATLSDGTFLSFGRSGGTCQGATISPCWGFIEMDVNGFKAPNTYGKDVYIVYITPAKLVPSTPDGFYGCDIHNNNGRIRLGEACASLVLTNTDY